MADEGKWLNDAKGMWIRGPKCWDMGLQDSGETNA